MRPAWSVIWFTSLLGCAQGLVLALALAGLGRSALPAAVLRDLLGVAFVIGVVALGCSFAHLGQPLRAWRAAAMYRTSWLSREVIAVSMFLAVTLSSVLVVNSRGVWPVWLQAAAVLEILLLWLCTGKVYSAIDFIREWATPLTPLNFALMGLASGHLVGAALLAALRDPSAGLVARLALFWTVLAWGSRGAALARLGHLRRVGSTQSAIGAGGREVRQISRGFTAGSFNLDEFGLHAGVVLLRHLRSLYMILGFAVPSAGLAAMVVWGVSADLLALLAGVQFGAFLAERWDFFAQVDHPQNRYYEAMQ